MKVLLDKEDEPLFDGRKIYYSGSYPTISLNGKNVRVHKIVMGDSPDGLEIDHINRNKLDNRKINLRFVTHADNLRNRSGWSYSKLKGAYFNKRSKSKPWKSEIRINGVKTHIGYYATAEQAHQAYLSKLPHIDV